MLLVSEASQRRAAGSAELSAMARSFYDDNKRVDNARIKRELGVALRYPDYRAGLRALLAGNTPDGGMLDGGTAAGSKQRPDHGI